MDQGRGGGTRGARGRPAGRPGGRPGVRPGGRPGEGQEERGGRGRASAKLKIFSPILQKTLKFIDIICKVDV